jgi:hypothetical protein
MRENIDSHRLGRYDRRTKQNKNSIFLIYEKECEIFQIALGLVHLSQTSNVRI